MVRPTLRSFEGSTLHSDCQKRRHSIVEPSSPKNSGSCYKRIPSVSSQLPLGMGVHHELAQVEQSRRADHTRHTPRTRQPEPRRSRLTATPPCRWRSHSSLDTEAIPIVQTVQKFLTASLVATSKLLLNRLRRVRESIPIVSKIQMNGRAKTVQFTPFSLTRVIVIQPCKNSGAPSGSAH